MRATSGDRPTASGTRAAAAATAAVAAAVSLVLITGCGKVADHRASDTGSSSPTASPTPSVNPSYGTQYLAENECAAPVPGQPEAYREVSCKDPEAVAKVIDRADIGISEPFSATSCSPHTDFAINVPVSLALLEDRPVTGEGYACMRNLKPPHPGDTGGGGGPRIEVGDCVRGGSKTGDVVGEVACRTKGKKGGAVYRITKILEDIPLGGFSDPCDYKADAVFTENPLLDPDKVRNDRVLCAKKL
ncbi:hypothetical protein ACIO6T_13985 [Streptomyces sp. NPDC087532]|uniref:hypothetical protein n=1 Tax=Streptomyces sp. NPDC087532 TaxID=3365795 RepID=UPI00380CB47A